MPMAENLRGLADLGLMGLSVPPEYGGMGAPFVISGAVFEMLARGDASTIMQYAFCVAPATMILRFGSDEQEQRWVPRVGERPPDWLGGDDRARGGLGSRQHPHRGDPSG